MKRLRRILRRGVAPCLLAAVSVAVTVLLLELGVRWLAPQQLIVLRPDIWQPIDGVGWRHRPNADTVINTGDGPARVLTDGRGHRVGPQPPPAEAAPRVLALGDSLLEAIQVDHEDTFAARLEAMLSAARGAPARVVNAGVGGWGPDQYLIEARDELARQRYDAVLVFVYLPNDRVLRRRERFSARQAAARRSLRWPRSLTRREWIDAVAYPINDVLERRSHLFTLLKTRGKFLLMRLGLSKHYFPSVLVAGDAAAGADAWTLTAEALGEIRDLAAIDGAPTLVVLLPGVYQVDAATGQRYARAVGLADANIDLDLPSRLLGHALEQRAIRFVDTLPDLRAALAAGRGPLYGKVDTHFSKAGHAVVAESVLPELVALLDVASAETDQDGP